MDRDVNKLEAGFKLKVLRFLQDQRTKDLSVFVTEARRTLERQKELYAQGRTKPGRIVTWTLKSKHIDGLAIDIACANPKLGLYPTDYEWWNKVYDVAEDYGILSLYREYGVDRPHLEQDPSKPTKDYITNSQLMDKLFNKQLEVVINANSVLWNLTEDEEVKKALEACNKVLRTKKDD